MAVLQSTPRRSVAKQAALANRLNAGRTLAPHILSTTIEDPNRTKEVGGVHATNSFFCGTVFVLTDEHFWLVKSRCDATRFYVVVRRNGEFQCSSSEVRVSEMCIQKVVVYLAERKEAARSAKIEETKQEDGTVKVEKVEEDGSRKDVAVYRPVPTSQQEVEVAA